MIPSFLSVTNKGHELFCPWPFSNKTAMDGVKPSMAGKLRSHTYNFRHHHQLFVAVFVIMRLYNTGKTEKSIAGREPGDRKRRVRLGGENRTYGRIGPMGRIGLIGQIRPIGRTSAIAPHV
jgi:hypothetical protein